MLWKTRVSEFHELCQFHKVSRMPVHMEVIILIPEWKHCSPHVYIVILSKLENVKHLKVEYLIGYINLCGCGSHSSPCSTFCSRFSIENVTAIMSKYLQ